MARKNGFTLIELLTVIGIIGLLAALVFISLTGAKKRARDTQTIVNLKTICKALEAYYVANGHYPFKGCSYSGQDVSEQYGVYRDAQSDNNNIFDILQPYLAKDIISYVPNDPNAKDPATDWSYFYDNYYDSVNPSNTPETSSCTDQAFQLLGYIEVSVAPDYGWEPTWGTWMEKGWWRACKGYH